MPTTPNMSLVLPTDHDTADTWGALINAALTAIDAHTHATGSGAKVLLSQLSVDADISFVDAGGGKHAIKDLKAIDFFPSPPSAMAGFAGAFFVSDGTGGTVANELYYRTMGGANVQVTNGASMNFSFFVGGIGGDYSAVGALESFDDGTDAYWFQQQVGAGSVRQWAKMQCADIKLFEFKSTAVGVVPGNNITLKAPAALANTFSLTLPGALPSSTVPLSVDASGNIAAGALDTITVPAGIGNVVSGTFTRGPDGIITSTASGAWYIPIQLPAGARVQSATIAGFGDGAVDVVVQINYISKSNVLTTKATANITNAPAAWNDTTATPGAPSAMAAGDACNIVVAPNATGFSFNNIRVSFDRP